MSAEHTTRPELAWPSRVLRCAVQVVAHSVGTWNAYEFLRLAQREGLPMPRQAFLSGQPLFPVRRGVSRAEALAMFASVRAFVGALRC